MWHQSFPLFHRNRILAEPKRARYYHRMFFPYKVR